MSRMSFSERLWPGLSDEAIKWQLFASRDGLTNTGSAFHLKNPFSTSGHRPILGIVRRFTTGLVALAGVLMAATPQVAAQGAGILSSGDLAITGFSGTQPSVDGSIDTTFIDLDGASLKVFDIGDPGPPRAQLLNVSPKFEVYARDIGQVFGVALDDAAAPNIYVSATSAQGLQIVGPDNNADGLPDRIKLGQPGARFMDGQFGVALGGGPGSVWKIDGLTGAVTLFANIETGGVPNSGPGLGNIAYDPAHYQLFVSDLDTGIIHRLGMAGNDLGTFDHGAQGRPAAGFDAVPMDPANVMDITSPVFNAENSNTWGLADPRRRVWGLAYHRGRLYYGVEEGPQIWSVGIATDGSFAGDPRLEIDLVPGAFPVSDILFTPRGRMIVAQRGGILGSYDYTQYQQPKTNRVLRYRQDAVGQWVQEPQEYAIGFPNDHQNTSGGVALSCSNRLWSTGDSLRQSDDPVLAGQLALGGPAIVHGLQGNKLSLVRPRNVPPWSSYFLDYDGQFADATKAGHVGDVEVYRNCKGGRAQTWPGWTPGWAPPPGWIPPPWWPETPDLEIEKSDSLCTAAPGLIPGVFECTFTFTVTNVGHGVFVGNLSVIDNVPPNMEYVPPPGGSIPWNCVQPGGAGTPIDCTSQNVETLLPGESETLELTFRRNFAQQGEITSNCATIDRPGDPHGNNEDCGDGYPPGPDLEMQKTLNLCVTTQGGTECTFWLDVINWGNAVFNGPLHVVENLPAGASFNGIVDQFPPGWNCWAINPGEVNCTNPGPVTLWPGDVAWVEVSIFIPFGAGGNLLNCAKLGDPEHAGDPNINDNNSDCEPFTGRSPQPLCSDMGLTDVPPGGVPLGWQGIAIDGINPDNTKWGLTCMKELPLVPLMGPGINFCPQGWTKYPNRQSVPKGWKKMTVGKGKKAIVCARYVPPPPPPPPPALNCPSGWKQFPSSTTVPRGWKQMRVGRGRSAIVCGRYRPPPPPPPVTCPSGWKQFPSSTAVPRGWQQRHVGQGRNAIFCGRYRPPPPPPRYCPSGWKQFPSSTAVPRGWQQRRVGQGRSAITCARYRPAPPPPPRYCPSGWKQFPSSTAVPRGWQQRRVGKGQNAIICALPRVKSKPERCWKGWKKVPLGWRQTGWTVRQKSGRPPLYCAKRQKVTPTLPPPVVTPGTCGPGYKRKGSRCVKIVRPKPPRKPIVCRKGQRLIGRRCVTIKPLPKKPPKTIVCRKGQRLVGRRCVTIRPRPQTPPKIKILCPKGQRMVGRRCVTIRPAPTIRPLPKRPAKRPPSEINPRPTRPPQIMVVPQLPQLRITPGLILCARGLVPYRGKCVKPVK